MKMDNREKVERLNQAIAILKPVLDSNALLVPLASAGMDNLEVERLNIAVLKPVLDSNALLVPLVGYRNFLLETIEREKEKRDSAISSKWFV